jgi:hypothetical protein
MLTTYARRLPVSSTPCKPLTNATTRGWEPSFRVRENLITPCDGEIIPGPGVGKCLPLRSILAPDVVIELVVIALRINGGSM